MFLMFVLCFLVQWIRSQDFSLNFAFKHLFNFLVPALPPSLHCPCLGACVQFLNKVYQDQVKVL